VFGELGDVDSAALLLTLDDGGLGLVSNSRYQRARLRRAPGGARGGRQASPRGWTTGSRCARWDPVRSRRPARRTRSSWTASPPPSGPSWPRSSTVVRGAPSPCTVDDALETAFLAEAATLSLREHRPVGVAEVRAG
jgi:myo-inositol 2-dehydrogenase/D-chiro-inositol 1-dehydrogenase